MIAVQKPTSAGRLHTTQPEGEQRAKLGDKVMITYSMTATQIEVKADKGAATDTSSGAADSAKK
ncbi:MAG TPA: hypothetical protein VK993_13500, partial [Chthoniobacterales bacterium]|nr:hypothetical protein [Chthoniobacterales bacterium]